MSAVATESEIAEILAARSPQAFLNLIEPRVRRLVDSVDKDVLDVFDDTFQIEAMGLVSTQESQAVGASQEAGLGKNLALYGLVPLLINIAATLCVERFKTARPDAFGVIVGAPSSDETALRYVHDLIGKSNLPQEQKDRLLDTLAQDRLLTQAMTQTPMTTKK